MALKTWGSLCVTSYTGTLIEHKIDKKSPAAGAGYKPTCVLLLPRSFNNNSGKCFNQNQMSAYVQDSNARTPRKQNSGGVRKAILNKRQDDTETVKRKPKGRRKLIVPRKRPPKTPLSLKLSNFPGNNMGCTLEYYLTHFNMFRDPDDARAIISEFLRGHSERERKEPNEQNSYLSIYGELYERHLEHMRRKIQTEGEEGEAKAGMGRKTALHIHQHCTCTSHDVRTE